MLHGTCQCMCGNTDLPVSLPGALRRNAKRKWRNCSAAKSGEQGRPQIYLWRALRRDSCAPTIPSPHWGPQICHLRNLESRGTHESRIPEPTWGENPPTPIPVQLQYPPFSDPRYPWYLLRCDTGVPTIPAPPRGGTLPSYHTR